MKAYFNLAVSIATAVSLHAATAQAPSSPGWLGVWQGQLDGQPSVTLTLADDGGTLGGTLVLDLIEKQGDGSSRVVAIDPHVLMRTEANEHTLSFEVIRRDRSEPPIRFSVVLDGSDKAHIHCLNCGPDAPFAEIVRQR